MSSKRIYLSLLEIPRPQVAKYWKTLYSFYNSSMYVQMQVIRYMPDPQTMLFICNKKHSLIRGVLLQSCPAGAKNVTNYVFCHPQFSGVIQNIENDCAILTPVCLGRLSSK